MVLIQHVEDVGRMSQEQREAVWTVAALHQWEMGIDDPRCIESAEEVRVPVCAGWSPCAAC